jgi:catechol 2,3-dioxygenase-like lactoylglutathione lyase family enzyme
VEPTTHNPLDQIDPDDMTVMRRTDPRRSGGTPEIPDSATWIAGHDRKHPDVIRNEHEPVLLDGIHHVAVLSSDTDRLIDFYQKVFDATVEHTSVDGPVRLTFLSIGPNTELNIFEIEGNDEAAHQAPMFGRGRLDHFGLRAASLEAFTEIRRRLIDLGGTDGFVTDFGPVLSVFFSDPDGLEGEVCVPNPDARPDVRHPPGTPSARFSSR